MSLEVKCGDVVIDEHGGMWIVFHDFYVCVTVSYKSNFEEAKYAVINNGRNLKDDTFSSDYKVLFNLKEFNEELIP